MAFGAVSTTNGCGWQPSLVSSLFVFAVGNNIFYVSIFLCCHIVSADK